MLDAAATKALRAKKLNVITDMARDRRARMQLRLHSAATTQTCEASRDTVSALFMTMCNGRADEEKEGNALCKPAMQSIAVCAAQ